jgi:hypothetical protein
MEFKPLVPPLGSSQSLPTPPEKAKNIHYSFKTALGEVWKIAKGKHNTKVSKSHLKDILPETHLKIPRTQRNLFRSKVSRALPKNLKKLRPSSYTKAIEDTAVSPIHELATTSAEPAIDLDKRLNLMAIEIFGPKSWNAAMRSPKADEFKARAKAFLEKREKIKARTENLQFRDTALKKTLDKVTLDSFQQMREMKRALYNLRKLFSAVKKIDKEGQQLVFDIHAITQQEKILDKIKNGEELSEKEQGAIPSHTFEPDELIFVLKHSLKTSINPKSQEIFDKLSLHEEAILQNKLTLSQAFNQDEILYLNKKKMLTQDATTGQLRLRYPPKKPSAIIQDRQLLEARNYKPLMDDLEVHQRLQKRYSIAGSTNPAEIVKRIKKGLQTPRAFLNVAGSITKTGAKAGGVVESTTLVHPILGPITLALGVINIGGNSLNTASDLIQLKQSKDKQKVSRQVYQEFKENPNYKELAAVAKRLKNHHNYREDILGAFVHGNKTLLAVAGVTVGAVVLGLSIAGSAVSMGIAAPLLGAIGGASFGLTAGLISYKLSTWANREIRTRRWKKPHFQLEALNLCKHELMALRSNPERTLDPAIYKNDKAYKTLLEKSEAYKNYFEENLNKMGLESDKETVEMMALKNEALIFARMSRLEAALPQGAWFDKLMGSAQKLPLIGRSIKCVWGGPHLQKVSQEWNQNIQQAMEWSLIQHQADLIGEDRPIALNDYERGLFRMHPSYNTYMAEASELYPLVKAEGTNALENQAIILLYKTDFKQKLQKEIVKNLESKGIFKGNEALQTKVTELVLDLRSSKEEAALTLDTLKAELENHLSLEQSDAMLANNYQGLKAEAFYALKIGLEENVKKTLFGEKLIKDLEQAKNQAEMSTEQAKEKTKAPKYFNIEHFEQGFSKNRFSKDSGIQEEIKLHYISRSNNYSIKTIVMHLKEEQSSNLGNNFHNINTSNTPWTQFMTDLGASKQDLQAILRSKNDNLSANLLSKIILRN